MSEGQAQHRGRPLLSLLRRLAWRRRRVPYIQQTTYSDCGAACLAMVLRHHGRSLSLEEVREVTGFGRTGADARALVDAAQWFGLRARGVRVESLEDLELLEAGSILHWQFNHFVVYERIRRRGVDVVDPARGRRNVSFAEAGRCFTGVALLFEAGEEFRPQEASGDRVWRRARRYLRVGPFARVLALSGLVQVLALAAPLVIGLLIDRVLPARDYDLLTVLSGGLLAMACFHLLSSAARAHLLLHLRTRMDTELTLDFLEHMMALPFSFFQRRSVGDLMMRLNSNSSVREILTTGALSTVLDGVLAGIYLLLLLAIDYRLLLLVLGLAAARVAIFLVSRRRHRELMSELLHAQSSSHSYQVQMLAGVESLKACGAEPQAIETWSNIFVEVMNATVRRGRLSAWVDSSLEALTLASPLVFLLYASVLVLDGELSIGVMLAANALAIGFLAPLTRVVATAFQFQLLGSYLERISEVFDLPPEQDRRQPRRPFAPAGRITLECVGFRYASKAPFAVRDVSVDIMPGQLVALVGRSGAGKSTLACLLAALFLPVEGRVLLDGTDLRELDLRTVRRRFGFVPQHPYLFGQSIRANIALADPAAPLERVVEAAHRARIHDDIVAMPMGYETVLDDAGASLSGGQRQRLALARALLTMPSALILDEATSALDAVTEKLVHDELASLSCTRIVVAHRLSTVRNAELIVVMEDGKAVERGRHDELMERGKVYRELVMHQVEKDASPPPAPGFAAPEAPPPHRAEGAAGAAGQGGRP